MNRGRSWRGCRECKIAAELIGNTTSAKAIMVRDVLDRNCTLNTLKNCKTHHLERLLLKVINLSPAQNSKEDKPVWWPDDVLPFNEHIFITRPSALAAILDSCLRFYRDNHPASSGLKQNVMLSPLDLSYPAKLQCRDYLSMKMQPVILLKDVLKSKYPVLDKEEFMGFLKLQKRSDNAESFTSEKVTFKDNFRYSMKIPFSSTHGRKVLLADHYALNERFFERKRDWTNVYLRDDNLTYTSPNAVVKYNVTYKKKTGSDHVYHFPRRQQRQRENSMHSFRQAFCRPVHVSIKRINILPYLIKQSKCRRVSVMIDKSETDKIYNKKYASRLTL